MPENRKFSDRKDTKVFKGGRSEKNDKSSNSGRSIKNDRDLKSDGLTRRQRHKGSKASPARSCALEALIQMRQRNAFAHDIIEKVVDTTHLDAEDKAFATRLVLGVVQMEGSLDYVIDHVLESPKDIKPDVRCALRISTYEILYLGKSDYAAVSQGVELVKWVAPKAAGVANFALRKIAKEAAFYPFGNPKTDLCAYARLKGFPEWLCELLIRRLGISEADAFMDASNVPAPVYVAINSLKGNEDDTLGLLKSVGDGIEPGHANGKEIPGCYKLLNPKTITDGRVRRACALGDMLVADAASQFVAYTCAMVSNGDSLLEIGAGRATKTILLQSDSLRIRKSQIKRFVSVDNIDFKTNLAKKRVEDFDAQVSSFICADATDLNDVLGKDRFQCVFIDAPCTGLGTLRRHPEIRWKIKPKDIEAAALRDIEILKSASMYVEDSGVLVYSTCTITHEENEGAIAKFLESSEGSGFELVSKAQVSLEIAGCDSHFVCILKRTA